MYTLYNIFVGALQNIFNIFAYICSDQFKTVLRIQINNSIQQHILREVRGLSSMKQIGNYAMEHKMSESDAHKNTM